MPSQVQVEVPKLVGLPLEKARDLLLRSGLRLGELTYEESRPPKFPSEDAVLLQGLAEGSRIDRYSEVGLTVSRRSYLRYLPGIYQQSASTEKSPLEATLRIAQHVFDHIEDTKIDLIHTYLNPFLTPPEFLPWLASCLGLTLNESLAQEGDTPLWTDEKKRYLIDIAAELYRLRGTLPGFMYALETFASIKVRVLERAWPAGLTIGVYSTVGIDTFLVEEMDHAHCFIVEWMPSKYREYHPDFIRNLRAWIDSEKPGHTKCYLDIKEPREEKSPHMKRFGIGVRSTIGRDVFVN